VLEDLMDIRVSKGVGWRYREAVEVVYKQMQVKEAEWLRYLLFKPRASQLYQCALSPSRPVTSNSRSERRLWWFWSDLKVLIHEEEQIIPGFKNHEAC